MLMFSILQTFILGYVFGEVPYDDNELVDRLFGKVGIRRVETKRFIRFEDLKVKSSTNGYWFSRQSFWFIRFSFCKTDQQLAFANIVALIIVLQVIGRLFYSFMSLFCK